MDTTIILVFFGGFALGAVIVLILMVVTRNYQTRNAEELARQLFQESEAQRRYQDEITIRAVENSFARLSQQALTQSKQDFLQLASTRLDAQLESNSSEMNTKKELIDQQLQQMERQLQNVAGMVQEFEKDREQKFGELSKGLEFVGANLDRLSQTTAQLQAALADNRIRGQWGERVAEDILQMLGFVENINYLKQAQTSVRSRPDFTFLLPQDRILHMDVKFPYDNYMAFLQTDSAIERETYRKNFLRDVRNRVKELTKREYISPADNTLDYALMFIPNEQIYHFIHEHDSQLLQSALERRVVMCSPVTLFAVLAVIRQAVENFALEQSAREVLVLLENFYKQWGMFMGEMDKLGSQLDAARDSYHDLTIKRRKQLERPLRKIDDLKNQFDSSDTVLIQVRNDL